MTTKSKSETNAAKWVAGLSNLNHITGNSDAEIKRINTTLKKLAADYPFNTFQLIDSRQPGGAIGLRRVFGDRSYCDQLFKHAHLGLFEYGILSAGMLGTAGNGVQIHDSTMNTLK